MAGSLSIPRSFATSTGDVSSAYLDDNFTAGKDYINAREITIGTLAGRPAASTAGRWYFASDSGILYVDTGTTWTAVSFAAEPPGGYRVGGVTGAPNAGTPLTQYDLAADVVVLRHPTAGGVVVRTNTGAITNNVATAGSTANGRDQAGAFSAGSWVHFFFIWNGSTLATVSSATAPPTGPTLPSGYTHWAYAGAVRFNGSSQLIPTRLVGALAFYETRQSALSAGAATSETAVSLTTLVPPNAGATYLQISTHVLAAGAGANNASSIRVIAGAVVYDQTAGDVEAGANGRTMATLLVQNISQQVFYLNIPAGAPTTATTSISVLGYGVPNGGE